MILEEKLMGSHNVGISPLQIVSPHEIQLLCPQNHYEYFHQKCLTECN